MQMEEQEDRVKGSSKRERVIEELKTYIFCIFCNICFAGYNIVSKVFLDKGMSRYVLVVYGHAFGTLATSLLAVLFERKNESKINVPVLRNIFFLGLLGAVLGRTLFYMGLEYTSPAFASAMGNIIPSITFILAVLCRKNESKIDVLVLRNIFFLGLLGGVLGRTLYYMGMEYTSSDFASAMSNITPSITFILAVLCRMENFDISKLGTQAKIGGTLIAFAGATLMTLYKGISVIQMHTGGSHQTGSTSKLSIDKDWIKGSLVLLVSNFSLAAFYILQTTTIKMYPAPITLTSLTCLSGTLLSTIMTAILDHKAASWKLSWNVLLAPLYSGIVIFGITTYVQTLVVRTRGPVFMTAFRPLSTVVVAIMGLLILKEAIYLGSVLGASLIVLGLYATLWGKQKEKEKNSLEHAEQANGITLEK